MEDGRGGLVLKFIVKWVVAVVGVDRGRVICGFLCGLAEVLTLGLSVSVCVLVAW